jgi:CheY-like chemotaxis protein
MTHPHILAVDDKPANLVVLDALLSGDYQMTGAHSGEEAIRIVAERDDIDLILMDVQMPVMDGFECARRIKELERARDIPIIFITAVYREDQFVKRGYAAGGIDYFSKPFDPELLKLKVRIYSTFRQKAATLREREQNLRDSEELFHASRKLSAFLETLPIGVLVADIEGHIVQSNEVIARIFRSSEPLLHDAYGELLGWWDAEGRMLKGTDGPLSRALAGTSSHNVEIVVRRLDGAAATFVCSASPLLSRKGDIVGAVIVLQDVTEMKRIEHDLEEKVTRLVAAGVELEHVVHH